MNVWPKEKTNKKRLFPDKNCSRIKLFQINLKETTTTAKYKSWDKLSYKLQRFVKFTSLKHT